jgi:DNA polymerase-3 subunit delta'
MNNPLNKVIGQQKVKTILEKIIESKRIPHALVFSGKEGVGKEFTAIQFAKLLALQNPDLENKDLIINSISNLSEPFIKYICALPRGKNEQEQDFPYDKLKPDEIITIQKEFKEKSENPYYSIKIPNANNIKINSIREISRFVSYSYEGNFKRIIILSNAHLMKDEAQNALLKNLEEPPENIIFILCTPYPNLLKETILSRCWRINFENLTPDEIKEVLINYFKLNSDLAYKISEISLGSVKTAIQYRDYDLELLLDKVIKILRYSFGRKFHSALIEMEEVTTDKVYLKLIITLIILWLSYYNKFRYGDFEIPLIQFNETIRKFAQKYSDIELIDVIRFLEELDYKIDRNINPNIIGVNIITKLSSLI